MYMSHHYFVSKIYEKYQLFLIEKVYSEIDYKTFKACFSTSNKKLLIVISCRCPN